MNEIITNSTWDENDGMSYVIDSILSAPGIRNHYQKNNKLDWIIQIGDKNLEIGIMELPPLQQEIIRLYFLEGKSLIDISYELNIPIELIYGHIRTVRVRLMPYV